MFRIGHGYDVHSIYKMNTKPLILGGVKVNANFSLKAHSDGDVILHAVTDSILGAASLGDIGKYFPSTNPQYQGLSSSIFLLHAKKCVYDLGYKISNIDITFIAQVPKISSYSSAICQNISKTLQLNNNQINFKSTTTDHLGFIGQKKGIACHSVSIIY